MRHLANPGTRDARSEALALPWGCSSHGVPLADLHGSPSPFSMPSPPLPVKWRPALGSTWRHQAQCPLFYPSSDPSRGWPLHQVPPHGM